jgi:electron transport complex protein RnfA
MSVKILLGILVAGILTENFVLSKFLGICPFLGVSKKLDTSVGMSGAVIFVMLIATAVTYPIYELILLPAGLEYLQTIVFILIIAALVQLVEIILKKFMVGLYNALGVYLPLITTNCAVLGVTILVITKYGGDSQSGLSFGEGYLAALFAALAGGLGFLVAMVMFSGVRRRLEHADIPKNLQGLPITLVAASIVSLCFMGFSRIVENLGWAL